MKHLLSINELFKSTYKSAAEKLKKLHPERSKTMMHFASEKGTSEFKKFHIDREWPHPFEFNNKDLLDVKDSLLGKFYIIGIEEKRNLRENFQGFYVKMMNEWGQIVWIGFTVELNNFDIFKLQIYFGPKEDKERNYERDFLFNNRKDAMELKKYLIEQFEEEVLPFSFDPREISINKLYTTN